MTHQNPPNRRGGALLVAIVLLAVLGIVAGMTIPQIIRDREQARLDLVRMQSQQLLDDALRIAESKRETNSEFYGETLTLGPDQQPFPGTFQVTTRYENGAFVGDVEYREKDRIRLRYSGQN